MPPRGEIASVVAARWARSRPHGTLATPDATALVLGDPAPHLPLALEDRGHTATRWHRVACPGQLCTPWPPPGPFGEVWVRMPRSSLEAAMLLHAAAGRVRHGGHIHLYGAGTEGIRSAARHFPAGADEARTALIKARCRVLTAARTAPPPRPDGLDSWRHEARVDWGSAAAAPGPSTPASSRTAASTRRPRCSSRPCRTSPTGRASWTSARGPGPWARRSSNARAPRTEVHLLEPDAISLAAAAVNVAEATRITGHGLSALAGHRRATLAGHRRATFAAAVRPHRLQPADPRRQRPEPAHGRGPRARRPRRAGKGRKPAAGRAAAPPRPAPAGARLSRRPHRRRPRVSSACVARHRRTRPQRASWTTLPPTTVSSARSPETSSSGTPR